MKINCKSLKLTLILSVIFTVIMTLFIIFSLLYDYKIIEILLNIFIGLFGSSIFALLLNIPAYKVSKRQLLEKLYQETQRLIIEFDKVKYLLNEYDEENVVKYIHAINNKKWVDEYNKIRGNKKIDSKYKEYKNNLANEYKLKNPNLEKKTDKKTATKIAKQQIDIYIEMLRKKSDEINQQYIKLSKQSTLELNRLLGDIEFFTGKKYYIKIHQNLYQPMYNMLNKIKEESYHFKLYLEDKGNESVVIEKIFELQKQLFSLKINENEEMKSYLVMSEFVNDMLNNLEDLRAIMYNIKPEKQEFYPIIFKQINKDS